VQVGLRDAGTLAGVGPVSLVHVPAEPRAAFLFDAPGGTGILEASQQAPLLLFGDGTARREQLEVTAVAHGGPLRVTVVDRTSHRLTAARLKPEAPAPLRVTVPVPAAGATRLRVLVDAPDRGAVKGATLQALNIKLGR
jgi:hypothetical protein